MLIEAESSLLETLVVDHECGVIVSVRQSAAVQETAMGALVLGCWFR